MSKFTNFTSFFQEPAKALADYSNHGFHIENKLISEETCDQLIQAAHTFENAVNSTWRPQMMPHKTVPLFFEVMKTPKILEIIKQLVGGPVSGIQSEFFYGVPATPGFAAHQDNFFVQAPQNNFASAWLALVDVTPESGGLIVYPGSHKEGDLPVRDLEKQEYSTQDPNARKTETILSPEYKAITPSVKKGSVLFIHGHLVHASNTNKSDYNRYVLLNTYIKQGVPFREGLYAGREEIPLI